MLGKGLHGGGGAGLGEISAGVQGGGGSAGPF